MTNELQIREGYDPAWIDRIIELHNKTEMKRKSRDRVSQAFRASFAVVSAWIEGQLIGFGRMVSDGEMYASIFDVVVDPVFQKRGIGRKLMDHLIAKAPGMSIHLTSTFGNEGFYERLGFRKHKTAMALYPSVGRTIPYLEYEAVEEPQEAPQLWMRDGFMISTDKRRLDHDAIHKFLSQSYWANGIPRETIVRSISGSVCFGIYSGKIQVGFARVISDQATFAYLADVFVIEEYRGRGLSKWLMECILAHPALQDLRRWMLGTRDAHGLYEKFGFCSLETPDRFMQINRPNIYLSR